MRSGRSALPGTRVPVPWPAVACIIGERPINQLKHPSTDSCESRSAAIRLPGLTTRRSLPGSTASSGSGSGQTHSQAWRLPAVGAPCVQSQATRLASRALSTGASIVGGSLPARFSRATPAQGRRVSRAELRGREGSTRGDERAQHTREEGAAGREDRLGAGGG